MDGKDKFVVPDGFGNNIDDTKDAVVVLGVVLWELPFQPVGDMLMMVGRGKGQRCGLGGLASWCRAMLETEGRTNVSLCGCALGDFCLEALTTLQGVGGRQDMAVAEFLGGRDCGGNREDGPVAEEV